MPPEDDPRDEQPIDQEEWQRAMTEPSVLNETPNDQQFFLAFIRNHMELFGTNAGQEILAHPKGIYVLLAEYRVHLLSEARKRIENDPIPENLFNHDKWLYSIGRNAALAVLRQMEGDK